MYTYLMLLEDEVDLNDEVMDYLTNNQFQILKHYKNLRMLKVNAESLLEDEKLDYIKHFELDDSMDAV